MSAAPAYNPTRAQRRAHERQAMLDRIAELEAALADAHAKIDRQAADITRGINERNRLWGKLGAAGRDA